MSSIDFKVVTAIVVLFSMTKGRQRIFREVDKWRGERESGFYT